MIENLPDYIEEAALTPYLKHNNIELTEYGEGYCKGRIKIEEHHLNLHRTVHGGCIFSLADAVASYTAMTDGTIITTIDGNINYLHPVIDTEYLFCEGKILKSGRTVTVVRTELYNDKNRLVAEGSFSCFVLGQR